MISTIDLNKPLPYANVYLTRPNMVTVSKIDKLIFNLNHSNVLKGLNEIKFDVLFYIEKQNTKVRNPFLDSIKLDYLCKFEFNGDTEWFKIKKKTKSYSNDKEVLSVTATSLEIELSQKKILNYEVKSKNCNEVLTDILANTRWEIGTIDPAFNLVRRDFEVNTKTALDFITTDICDTFGAVSRFNTVNRTVSIVLESSVGIDKGLRVSPKNYINQISVDDDTEQITTCLYPYGKDGLTINSVNPSSYDYIQDFSHYANSDYMESSLIGAIGDYNDLMASKAPIEGLTEDGTTTTNIKMASHGLSTGDWIVNRTRTREARKVTVVDSDNISVSSISDQSSGDEILMYGSSTFGKLLFDKEELQAQLIAKEREFDTLKEEKLKVLDTIIVHLNSKTYDSYVNSITNTSVNRTLSDQNSSNKYVAMCRISTTTGTSVTVNGVSKSFTADAWTVLDKMTGNTSHSIIVSTTGTNVQVKTVIVEITNTEYSTSGNSSDIINKYSEDIWHISINNKQNEMNGIVSDISDIDEDIASIRAELSMEENFTSQQLEDLKDFIYIDEFRDESFVDSKDLYDAALVELQKRNTPQVLYKVDIVDFLQSVTEQKNWGKLNLGDTIHVVTEVLNVNIKTKIIEIHRDFENQAVSITIANNKDIRTREQQANDLLHKVIVYANNLEKKQSSWNKTKENFSTRNDRNAVKPASPTISSLGTAIDHILNDNGSADISFEWAYSGSGDAYDIDGFYVYVHASDSNGNYVFGSTIARDQPYLLKSEKRAFALTGVPSNKYYTFGICAYRVVDNDISANGYLISEIVQPSLYSENPYRPSHDIAFIGDFIGTLDGEDVTVVLDNLNDLSDDNKLTPIKKQSALAEWNIIVSEKSTIESQADTYSITTEKITYSNAFQSLANYLNGGSTWSSGTPSMLSNLTTTDDVVGTNFRSNFKNYYDAKTALLKKISDTAKLLIAIAQTSADGKIVTYYQDAMPTGTNGDLWIDTNDGNRLYRHNGISFFTIQDSAIQTAISNAQSAQTTADGKIVTFYQDNSPTTGMSEGDLWFDTNDKNKLYRYTSGNWAIGRDTDIAQAITSAQIANDLLSDIANDDKLTPVEKQAIKKEWDDIVNEKSIIEAQATNHHVTIEKSIYVDSYDTLNAYITPILTSLNATSSIVRTVLRSMFNDYNNKKMILQRAINERTSKTPSSLIVADGSTSVNTLRADYIVPSGSTKAQLIINQAILALPTGGKIVLLEGTYIIDSDIIPYDNITIEGMGSSTIIKCHSTWSGSGSMFFYIGSNINIYNIKIEGDGSRSGINSSGSENSLINNIIEGCNNGIWVTGDDTIISNNTIKDSTHHGCLVTGDKNTVSSNIVIENGGMGIVLNTAINCSILGNICSNNAYNGINIQNSSINNVISSNTLQNNYQEGLMVQTDGNQFVGNICVGNGQAEDGVYSNIVITDGDYNSLQTNYCRVGVNPNKPSYGIRIFPSATGTMVTNNDLYNAGKFGGMFDGGTSTVTTSANRI